MANSLLLGCQEAAADRTQDAQRGLTAISGRYPHDCSRVAIKLQGGRPGRTAQPRQESTPICRSAAKRLSVDAGGHRGVTGSRVGHRTRVLPSRVEDVTRSQHLRFIEVTVRKYQTHIFIPGDQKTDRMNCRAVCSMCETSFIHTFDYRHGLFCMHVHAALMQHIHTNRSHTVISSSAVNILGKDKSG